MFLLPPPTHYPNLIFDLGGVLINLDYSASVTAFGALSHCPEPLAFNQRAQAPLFDALETGHLGAAEFRAALRETYQITAAPDEALDAAWNAMLLDVPAVRLHLLRALRAAGYRLFLLSNTNEIHRAAFDYILHRDHDLPDGLLGFFEQVYYSHEVGLRKPDPAIFNRVLADHHLSPAHTLFIDDSPQHITAAQAVGISTLWLAPGQDITAPTALLHALRGQA